jgi:peptidyl-dipeptidase Dcp
LPACRILPATRPRGDAEERGLAGHAVTLSRSSVEPFLQFSARRELREKAFRAWIARGTTAARPTTTRPSPSWPRCATRRRGSSAIELRGLQLDDTMAKTPAAVTGLLDAVWAPARRRVAEERDALQEIVTAEGGNFRLAPWDWRYYAEKLRKARFDLD